MLHNETMPVRLLDALLGALVITAVTAGSTYFIQSSLVIYKHYGGHMHWTAILIGVPVCAGLFLRIANVAYPLFSSSLGAACSAAILYPLYKGLWAEPPTTVDLAIYTAVILGISYIATQPLRTTFMLAFRLGRFSVPRFSSDTPSKKGKKKAAPKKKAAARSSTATKANMSKSQRLQTSDNGNMIALLELVVGLTSLALSIFSIFFLGRA